MRRPLGSIAADSVAAKSRPTHFRGWWSGAGSGVKVEAERTSARSAQQRWNYYFETAKAATVSGAAVDLPEGRALEELRTMRAILA